MMTNKEPQSTELQMFEHMFSNANFITNVTDETEGSVKIQVLTINRRVESPANKGEHIGDIKFDLNGKMI